MLDLAPEPQGEGSLDPRHIDRRIKKYLADIQYCYEFELTRKPDLHGKIVVNFKIRPDGRVAYARIKSSTMNDAAVEACLTREFLKIEFEAPGGIVTVNYPLLFKNSR